MSTLVGIDIGGTFTDVVALNNSDGSVSVTKVPSTPHEYSDGFFNGLDKICRTNNVVPKDIERLVHGTTVATNAILEKKGSTIGILTTKGFRDVLIVGRGTRSILYNVNFESETPDFLCPRERITEVEERVDASGNIITPLNEDDVIRNIDFLVKELGVKSVAVCYLFSFYNNSNEEKTYELIKARYPEVRVSLSSRINPRFREYERTVVTAFDAYIGPVMDSYISCLENKLDNYTGSNILQLMQSRGGITSAAMCASRPVLTLLSGPAAGVIGGKTVADKIGRRNVLTLDLGGTSNDVALIQNGEIALSIDGKIGSYPCRQAMMDISTIGAGGGSIAWVDAGGWLRVGPHSAGSFPGPACYCKGGKEPTYTDASLVLGYLSPGAFAGGEISLDYQLAFDAINDKISSVINMSVYDAASAIHRIMHNRMADQLRLATVKRGHDPRNFSILAFGGAGPIAACKILSLIDFKEVIIPPTPGVMAAIGLLSANIEHEEVVTVSARTSDVDTASLDFAIQKGIKLCEAAKERAGITGKNLSVTFSAEMRYVGQSYELEVPFSEAGSALNPESLKTLEKRFHSIHADVYKHSFDLPVEITAVRVLYTQCPSSVPIMEKIKTGEWAKPKGSRRAFFDEYSGWADCNVFERASLVSGQIILGPAIIEQADTTTVIYPDQRVDVDEWGNLIVTMA